MLGVCGTTALLLVGTHVYDVDALKTQLQTLRQALQTVGIAEKYRMADALKACLNSCLHHRRVTALGEHYALRMQTGCVVEVARELCLLTQQLHKILLVGVPVGDGLACYSTLYCSLGNSRTHLCDKTRVDGFRDEVFRTEREVVNMIYLVHDIGHGLLCEVGNGMNGSELHFFVDATSVNVEGATEDVRETDYVVNLIGIVASACRHEHVGAACHCVLVANLGHGVGKGEHDWLVCHRADHILREHVALRESDEHVGALHSFLKGVYIGALCGEQGFLRSEVLTVDGDNTLRVEHHDILYFCAKRYVQLSAADGSCSCSVYNNLYVGDVLAGYLKRILQAGCRDDGCAVLVVVHHGDVEGLLQTLFDVEALRSLNVLKVDAAEGRRNLLYCLAELLRIFFGNLDVEHINATIYLKEQAFAFHNWLAAHRSNVAKT